MIASFVNGAILVLSAAVFHKNGMHEVAEIQEAYKLLSPLLGTTLAGTLFAVALLTVYHLECQRIYTQQKNGTFRLGSFKLRLFNELATVFLVAIVFLVVVKSTSGLVWGLLGLLGFAGILMMAVALYKRSRKEKEQA